jgi:rhodanese-related sulfurtransferase
MSKQVPEISPIELKNMLSQVEPPFVLDVRENWEIALAHLSHERVLYAPLSQLSRQGIQALPEPLRSPQSPVVVVCHHGMRSAQVAGWLIAQGWQNVHSLAGGLDAYARTVDPEVGLYS